MGKIIELDAGFPSHVWLPLGYVIASDGAKAPNQHWTAAAGFIADAATGQIIIDIAMACLHTSEISCKFCM